MGKKNRSGFAAGYSYTKRPGQLIAGREELMYCSLFNPTQSHFPSFQVAQLYQEWLSWTVSTLRPISFCCLFIPLFSLTVLLRNS